MKSLEQQAQSEFVIAKAELQRSSAPQAVVRFYARQDAAVSTATATATVAPACKAGCSYCCYYKVEARAAEVLAVKNFVVSRFPPDRLRAVIEQAERNVAQAKGLSHGEHLATNQRCPFLIEDRCSVYEVRPSKCRSFHAADVEGCKASYDEPTNLSIPNSFIEEIFNAANGVAEGFYAAMGSAGIDSTVYDLNSAFLEAMRNASVPKRLSSGKRAFLKATVVTLPDSDA
jgi:Fe-S-cluster containining protein